MSCSRLRSCQVSGGRGCECLLFTQWPRAGTIGADFGISNPGIPRRFPLSPFRWLIGGLLSNQLGGLEFRCRDQEVTFATPPAGAGTCSDFLGDFVAASTGFITNPDATGVPCGYCQYATGDEYLNTLETAFSQRWRSESDSSFSPLPRSETVLTVLSLRTKIWA